MKKNLDSVEWQDRFEHQKFILFNEDDFESKGTKFQAIKLKPGGKIEKHFHKVRTEVFYVLRGEGTITLNSDEISVSKDDFLLCKPETVHSFLNNGTEDLIIAVFRTNDPGDSDMLWVDK